MCKTLVNIRVKIDTIQCNVLTHFHSNIPVQNILIFKMHAPNFHVKTDLNAILKVHKYFIILQESFKRTFSSRALKM